MEKLISDQDTKYSYARTASFNYNQLETNESPRSWNGEFGLGGVTDRRFAFSRQASFLHSPSFDSPRTPVSILPNESVRKPFISRTVSSIDIPSVDYLHDGIDSVWTEDKLFSANSSFLADRVTILGFFSSILRAGRFGNRPMKRLFLLISLNVAYSTAELCIGLVTGRFGMLISIWFIHFRIVSIYV